MILMKRLLPLLFIFFIFGAKVGVAQTQKNYIRQSQYWLRYTNRLDFNKHVNLFSEIENRRFFPVEDKSLLNSDLQSTFLIRSVLQSKLGAGWSAGVGLAYFLHGNSDPRTSNYLVIPEWRPFAEMLNQQQLGSRFRLNQRFRYEERFFRKTTSDRQALAQGYTNNARFRYLFEADWTLVKTDDGPGTLKLKVSDEVMLNIGKRIIRNTFDQNRLSASLHFQVTKALAMEAGYIKWIQELPDGVNYYNRDILRISLHQAISLAGKE
jgi:hypothetical protein